MLCLANIQMETQMTEEVAAAAPEATYQLTLKGAGVTIERTIPESVALSVISIVMGGDAGPAPMPRRNPPATTLPGGGTGRPGVTVGEFMTAVEAKRHPDKILAFGAYLMDEMGRETFTRDEVRSMFQRAAEPVPANFHRDFTWAVSNRWLGEQTDTPGAYYVTITGRKALENKFAAEVKAATKLTRRRRARKTSTTTAGADGK